MTGGQSPQSRKMGTVVTDDNSPAESHAAYGEPFIQIMGPLLDALQDGGIPVGKTRRNLTLYQDTSTKNRARDGKRRVVYLASLFLAFLVRILLV